MSKSVVFHHSPDDTVRPAYILNIAKLTQNNRTQRQPLNAELHYRVQMSADCTPTFLRDAKMFSFDQVLDY